MSLDKTQLRDFIRARGLAVVSTVSAQGAPEAALVNVAVNDDLELVFYAIETTRKCANLRRDPRAAAVIGWDGAQTLQFEGSADEPREPELEALKNLYAQSRPDAGLQMAWPGLTWFRLRPAWIRFSDYGRSWSVEEMSFPARKRPR
ncbi:MAG: pyridoxamine 5'-phosphate oxidase family protein [Alphaproteobacteria bacterium]|nr:pyridoxamine 5'-phosphate oxidase family protein [Alphaproteobacteria bacterium]MBV9694281.1 pyridoxamine 5'-phosphate oxidase family protein [Alphaproteobacteria bacterium]